MFATRIPSRLIICLLGAFGCGLLYSLRIGLSVAIVAMVNQTNRMLNTNNASFDKDNNDFCYRPNFTDNRNKNYQTGYLDWDERTQGYILGAYYITYTVSQILGGRLAEKFGAKWVCLISLTIAAIANALTPLAVDSVTAVLAIRLVIGFFHGWLWPALYSLYAQWFPTKERTTVISLMVFAANFGNVVTLPVTAWMCDQWPEDGWKLSFYSSSAVHLVWILLWVVLVYDSPGQDPRISDEELDYVRESLDISIKTRSKSQVPWIAILLSGPMWASAIGKLTGNFSYYMLAAKLPDYLYSMFGVNMIANGFWNSAIFIGQCIMYLVSGPLSEFVMSHSRWSRTVIRKIFQTIAMLGPVIGFCAIPLVGCNQVLVVGLMIGSMTVYGLVTGGEYPIVSELALDLSGTVQGVVGTFGNAGGFLAPIFVGWLLHLGDSLTQQWNLIFYITSAIGLFGAIFFLVFASAEPQPWVKSTEATDKQPKSYTD